MNVARNIDYSLACSYFKEAEKRQAKLFLGNMDTNFWLHRERINLDFVRETARSFSNPRIFIIAQGEHKGFYLYSENQKRCFQLFDSSPKFAHAEIA